MSKEYRPQTRLEGDGGWGWRERVAYERRRIPALVGEGEGELW